MSEEENSPTPISYARPITATLKRATIWRRVWDFLIGGLLILVGLLMQLVFCGLMGMAIVGGLGDWSRTGDWMHSHEHLVSALCLPVLLLIVNLAAFYDFYRRRRINTVYGTNRIMHLVPRCEPNMEWNGFLNIWKRLATEL